jgi:hypothetical protein
MLQVITSEHVCLNFIFKLFGFKGHNQGQIQKSNMINNIANNFIKPKLVAEGP